MDNRLYDIIISRRSIRKFKQEKINKDILEKVTDAGRLAPSAANLQTLEFIVIDEKETVDRVFTATKWAGYIAPAGNPSESERPVAYIAVLSNISARGKWVAHDIGACAENMIITALSYGIGSCWLGALDKEKLVSILNIPSEYDLDSIIALGYPDERPVVEEFKDSIKYWKDDKGTLHVPKKILKNLIHWNKF